MKAEDDLVTIARGFGVAETQVMLAYLRAYGISAFPAHVHTAAVAWHLTHAIGGVEIKVPVSQSEEAAALLADLEAETEDKAEPALVDFRRGFWLALVFLLFGVPPPARGIIRRG